VLLAIILKIQCVVYFAGMSLFSSFFVLLLVLIEASPTSASVSYLGESTFRFILLLIVSRLLSL